MSYYEDYDLSVFLEENVEAVIELIKKAYLSTKAHYKGKITDDFLYFNMDYVFNNGYCFYFAKMLKSVYKNAEFIVVDKNYAHISHILVLIKDEVYDIKGKRNLKKYHCLTTKELEMIEENHKHIDNNIYSVLKRYFKRYLDEYIKFNGVCIKKV